jgi:hypothetical protein
VRRIPFYPGAKVGADLSIPRTRRRSDRRVNEHDYNSLLEALNRAAAILARHRTPAPDSIQAYDAVKQARAKVLATVTPEPGWVERAA